MTRYTQHHAWLLSGSIALTVTACVLSRCCHEWTDYTVCNTAITRKRLWAVHLLAGVCIAPTALLIATSTDQGTGDYARSEPPKCSSPNYYTPPKRGASSLPRAAKLQARANALAATNGDCSDHGMACPPFCVCRTLYCTTRDGSSAAEYLGLILALLSVPLVLEFVSVVPESVLHNLAIFEEASACQVHLPPL